MESTYWIDTHCHMNEQCYRDDFDQYMQNARQASVLKSNLICMNRQDYLYSKQLKERFPQLEISFGYFPEDTFHLNEDDLNYLDSVADELLGIGEIGLDYYYSKDDIAAQKEMFIRQIEIANRHNKPIMIHSRNAARDTYDILKAHARTRVLMHCYSDSTEMMKEYLKLGYYISFAGVVTFKNAQTPKNNALTCPLDRMMIETDCPYLTPVPHRGKQNETSYVHYTGEYIAQLRGISNEQLQKQLMENFERFYFD